MPEIVTKYPKLLLQEMKDAHLACGVGAKQQILITCPRDRFCALPTGELCIFGLKEVPHMTQVHALDLFLFPSFAFPIFGLMMLMFGIGVVIGINTQRKRRP